LNRQSRNDSERSPRWPERRGRTNC
jgi:hypothetical protein